MNLDFYSGVIKEYLHDFNLPTCKVLTLGMYVVKDCNYIYNDEIYTMQDSGYVDSTWLNDTSKMIKVVDNYEFGKWVRNLTKKLVIRNNGYDSYTHEYLGEYLRFLRDYKGIDLMRLYNCYSGKTLAPITFNITKYISSKSGAGTTTKVPVKVEFANSQSTTHKIYVVPIRPFKEYTIAYDTLSYIEVCAGFYRNNKLLYSESNTYTFAPTYRLISNCSFSHPYLYTGVSDDDGILQFTNTIGSSSINFNVNANNLVMFIKVPINDSCQPVVLEGNYTTANEIYLGNNLEAKMANKIVFPNSYNGTVSYNLQKKKRAYMPSMLSLLNMGCDQVQYFSPRLLEYLYENAIIPEDYFTNNIIRVQKQLYGRDPEYGRLVEITNSGIFSENVKNAIYDSAVTTGLIDRTRDIIGYVDKDVERMIVLKDEAK